MCLCGYYGEMIVTFGDRDTEALFHRQRPRRIDSRIQRAALRNLRFLNNAATLDDLPVPPGNRLELLKGDRAGRHSIRINDQWRITFIWKDGRAFDVTIEDYH